MNARRGKGGTIVKVKNRFRKVNSIFIFSAGLAIRRVRPSRYYPSFVRPSERFFLFPRPRCFRRDKKFPRRILCSADEVEEEYGRGWGSVAIIVITITPVINDSEDSFFDCYALYLIIPWRKRASPSQTAAKSAVRRGSPFHPVSRAFKCLSSFQLRAAFLPDNRRVTRCPLSR